MLACVDVHYAADRSVAACLAFDAWTDAEPSAEVVCVGPAPAEYEPGAFYRRELPSVIAVVKELKRRPTTVVIDGYVWLAPGRKGLGAYVHEALEGTPVVGVAKRAFRGADAIEVLRGSSARPLYVTSVGMPPALAAEHVRAMHGPYRIPTLLKRVDRLCRDEASSALAD